MSDTKGDHMEIKNNLTVLQMEVTEDHKMESNVYSSQGTAFEKKYQCWLILLSLVALWKSEL